MTNSTATQTVQSTRFYGRVWRWHFFAAFLVIPFILCQSLTGVVYLWRAPLADSIYSSLRWVAPRSDPATYQEQLAAVLEKHPGEQLEKIEVPEDPRRSTSFYFSDQSGLKFPAFSDPYSGTYLGSVRPAAWLPGLSLSLHGGWPFGEFGSYFLELGASWAIVMILTGLYLWWPRHARGLAGVLYPRLKAGSRTLWRDLHSTVGIYASLIALLFLVTALPWTAFWGDTLLGAIQKATHQVSPTAGFFGASNAAQTSETATPHHGGGAHVSADSVSLDAIVETARREGLHGMLEIKLGEGHGPASLRNQLDRSNEEVFLQLDRHSGVLLNRTEWSDVSPLAKAIAYGVDLHEGLYFGRPNQIFNTIFASAFVWLAVSGFVGWYKRRPRGGLSAPPKRSVRYPRAAVAAGGILAVVLPLFGASVLVVALVDRIFGPWLSRLAAR